MSFLRGLFGFTGLFRGDTLPSPSKSEPRGNPTMVTDTDPFGLGPQEPSTIRILSSDFKEDITDEAFEATEDWTGGIWIKTKARSSQETKLPPSKNLPRPTQFMIRHIYSLVRENRRFSSFTAGFLRSIYVICHGEKYTLDQDTIAPQYYHHTTRPGVGLKLKAMYDGLPQHWIYQIPELAPDHTGEGESTNWFIIDTNRSDHLPVFYFRVYPDDLLTIKELEAKNNSIRSDEVLGRSSLGKRPQIKPQAEKKVPKDPSTKRGQRETRSKSCTEADDIQKLEEKNIHDRANKSPDFVPVRVPIAREGQDGCQSPVQLSKVPGKGNAYPCDPPKPQPRDYEASLSDQRSPRPWTHRGVRAEQRTVAVVPVVSPLRGTFSTQRQPDVRLNIVASQIDLLAKSLRLRGQQSQSLLQTSSRTLTPNSTPFPTNSPGQRLVSGSSLYSFSSKHDGSKKRKVGDLKSAYGTVPRTHDQSPTPRLQTPSRPSHPFPTLLSTKLNKRRRSTPQEDESDEIDTHLPIVKKSRKEPGLGPFSTAVLPSYQNTVHLIKDRPAARKTKESRKALSAARNKRLGIISPSLITKTPFSTPKSIFNTISKISSSRLIRPSPNSKPIRAGLSTSTTSTNAATQSPGSRLWLPRNQAEHEMFKTYIDSWQNRRLTRLGKKKFIEDLRARHSVISLYPNASIQTGDDPFQGFNSAPSSRVNNILQAGYDWEGKFKVKDKRNVHFESQDAKDGISLATRSTAHLYNPDLCNAVETTEELSPSQKLYQGIKESYYTGGSARKRSAAPSPPESRQTRPQRNIRRDAVPLNRQSRRDPRFVTESKKTPASSKVYVTPSRTSKSVRGKGTKSSSPKTLSKISSGSARPAASKRLSKASRSARFFISQVTPAAAHITDNQSPKESPKPAASPHTPKRPRRKSKPTEKVLASNKQYSKITRTPRKQTLPKITPQITPPNQIIPKSRSLLRAPRKGGRPRKLALVSTACDKNGYGLKETKQRTQFAKRLSATMKEDMRDFMKLNRDGSYMKRSPLPSHPSVST
jgi:hypothetical protein